MKITISGILNETPFTLGIWAARFKVCRGIINNFSDQDIQDVIDFKGKRDLFDYEKGGFANKVDIVWENYCEEEFDSAYWSKENRKFTSDFIMKAAARYKKCRLEYKKKKILKMKSDIVELEKEIKDRVA